MTVIKPIYCPNKSCRGMEFTAQITEHYGFGVPDYFSFHCVKCGVGTEPKYKFPLAKFPMKDIFDRRF